jgi:hypothetical protein
MNVGVGAWHQWLVAAKRSGRWAADCVRLSFSRSLVSSRRASPEVDQPAHAHSIGDLPQPLAGRRERLRREDAPKKPTLTQLRDP